MSVTRELMKCHLRSGAATTIILLHPKVARLQSILFLKELWNFTSTIKVKSERLSRDGEGAHSTPPHPHPWP